MTDALTAPIPLVTPLGLIVEPAESCEGDFCAIPEHHTQAVVNRKLDDDAV